MIKVGEILKQKCSGICGEVKDASEFNKASQRKSGLQAWCRSCDKLNQQNYANTLEGFLKQKIRSAKLHAKDRVRVGRIEAGTFNITENDLIEIWKKTNGRCYYSNILMEHKTNHHWSGSLERISQNIGYEKSNVALCCAEFNDAQQWTLEKISSIPQLVNKPLDVYHEFEIKNLELFLKDGCKQNIKKRKTAETNYLHTLIGRLKHIYSNAQGRNRDWKKIQKKGTGELLIEFSFEILAQQYIKQNGRCAYSNIGFILSSSDNVYSDFRPSCERINASLPYTKSNICFVCREFNTRMTENPNGNSGWNKKKFLYFWLHRFPHLPVPEFLNDIHILTSAIVLNEDDEKESIDTAASTAAELGNQDYHIVNNQIQNPLEHDGVITSSVDY